MSMKYVTFFFFITYKNVFVCLICRFSGKDYMTLEDLQLFLEGEQGVFFFFYYYKFIYIFKKHIHSFYNNLDCFFKKSFNVHFIIIYFENVKYEINAYMIYKFEV